MPNVDWEIGIFAALNTFEKIIMFTREISVEMNLFRPDNCVKDFIRTGLNFASPTFVAHPTVGADEFDTGVARFAGHDDTISIMVSHIVILNSIIQSALPESAGAFYLHRAATFGVVGPLRGI